MFRAKASEWCESRSDNVLITALQGKLGKSIAENIVGETKTKMLPN